MFIQTAALAAISLLLSALTCPMPAQAASELTTIRIAHNGFSSEMPFYVAKDAGIFVKHGFNVEPIFIVGGSTTIQALIGKSLDLLMGGATPMLSAVINGAQLKIIGGMNNRIPFALLAQPEIKTGAQLKGKKIGITRFGSNTDFIARLAAQEFGLNPKSDITIVQTGAPESRLLALKTRTVDATLFNIEQAVVARKLGYNVLVNFLEKEIDYTHIAIIARDDTIKTQPEMLRRFLRAYVESIRYFKTHKEEAVKKSMQLQKLADREAIETGYVSNVKALPDDGRPTMKGTQLVIDAAMLDDPRAKNYMPQQLTDLSFLP
ncbi:MAG: ABC transporter substrate-binding protein [Candidatus Binatota bacterium]|nr:ABC transporter substrate-binding protein [Candidatus Binatota bacterium]